jgi:hypothetical protein
VSAETERAAIARTLRDIRDGHIILTFEARTFNPHSGELLDQPQVYGAADRMPAIGFPAVADGEWWMLLARNYWITPDFDSSLSRPRWKLTEAGERVAAEAPSFGGER